MRAKVGTRSRLLAALVVVGAVAASAGSCQTTAGRAVPGGTPTGQNGVPQPASQQPAYQQGGDSVPRRSGGNGPAQGAVPGPEAAAPGGAILPGEENINGDGGPVIGGQSENAVPPPPPSSPG